tara:strand:- start:216 stop:710 length:495 start_codon:yes stop_codon:yes gene_type:complete
MKTSRYIEAQILAILRQAEGGMPVAELCRAHGTSSASFYKWRAQYGGMDASLISQMKVMEEENRRLRRMYADLSMRADLLSSGVPQGQHCAGLPGLWCQRDLLSLWPKVARRERGNRGSSGRPDGRQAGGMLPMGSSKRLLLNQSTHSRVAYSTASKLRHGPRL